MIIDTEGTAGEWLRAQQKHAEYMVRDVLVAGLNSGHSYSTRVVILKAVESFFGKIKFEDELCVLSLPLLGQMLSALLLQLQDAKFSVVRVAAMKALLALVSQPSAPLLFASSSAQRAYKSTGGSSSLSCDKDKDSKGKQKKRRKMVDPAVLPFTYLQQCLEEVAEDTHGDVLSLLKKINLKLKSFYVHMTDNK